VPAEPQAAAEDAKKTFDFVYRVLRANILAFVLSSAGVSNDDPVMVHS
jgi:hypothetical protein